MKIMAGFLFHNFIIVQVEDCPLFLKIDCMAVTKGLS